MPHRRYRRRTSISPRHIGVRWTFGMEGRPGGGRLAGRSFGLYTSLSTAGWSSLVARRAHNPKVAGSNPAPAIRKPRKSGVFLLPKATILGPGTKRVPKSALVSEPVARPSGFVFRLEKARGASWWAKYRLPDGTQVKRKIGPVWVGRGRPADGHFTKRLAEDWLHDRLEEVRRESVAAVATP